MRDLFVETNGIQLHVVEDGRPEDPLVILLHGFPEFWYGWHKQIEFLAGKSLRVWVPDQRGYNTSDKPKEVGEYSLDILARDVVGLIDAAGETEANVIGHDWGATVAWWVAIHYPERLRRLGILNVPHPDVMRRTVWRNPRQLLRSWYVGFVQLPGLPEWTLSRDNWEPLVRTFETTSRGDAFTEQDFERYREAWSQTGAMTAMLNWYRAIFQKPPDWNHERRVRVPTLMLWGKLDVALGEELAKPSIQMCDQGELVMFDHASHWLQHEEAKEVNTRLAEWIRK